MRFFSFSSLAVISFAATLSPSAPAQAQQTPPPHDHSHGQATGAALAPTQTAQTAPPAKPLPALPPGVAALAWDEFFRRPVGAYGLELTDKLRSLDGKRVRLVGFMVGQEAPTPGAFILAGRRLRIEDHEGGLSDLPPNVVRVAVPEMADRVVPFTTRPLLLTGVLSVGNQEEKDGSVWLARLVLDPTPKAPVKTASKPASKKIPTRIAKPAPKR